MSPGKVEIGQGIVTALAQIAADELDVDLFARPDGPRVDRGKPERGRNLGQPFDPAVRACASPGLCRNPAHISRSGVRSPRRRGRRARGQGRDDFRPRQCQHQLLETGRGGLARPRRHGGRRAEDAARRIAGRTTRCQGSTFRTRCLRVRGLSSLALPGRFHGHVLGRISQAPTLSTCRMTLAPRLPRSRRASCAMAISRRRDRNRAPRGTRHIHALRRAQHGRPRQRCRMNMISPGF